ncbi:MAG: ABC-F family ATP-binding cassette domain-containing protein, partial [Erysipelotrichaceae bacterium]|nr:ABC-F family ATP-binding cassette domain-containing protein [Erysipelotrichaceae bacterium]
ISSSSLPMIFISHDESLLENCSNGILHLEQLKRKQEARMTFARLNYSDYVSDRLHFIERNNSIAAKQKAEYFKQIEKYRQIYQKVEHQQATISRQDPHGGQLLKKKMHAVKSLGRKLDEKKENLTERFDPEEAINIFFADVDLNPGKVILDYHLDELTVGEKVLARNIELQVRGRDKVCLIGKNGSGKTTLLRMMKDVIMSDDSVHAGYMSQNYDEVMDFDISPVEFLKKEGTREEISRIRTHLGSLKFTAEEMEHDIRELSEGQKCKILLLKLILDGCNVLIMDEPTRNLSPLSNPQVRKMLIEYGGCIIAVSHDRKFIENVCDKVYMLDEDGLHSMM